MTPITENIYKDKASSQKIGPYERTQKMSRG